MKLPIVDELLAVESEIDLMESAALLKRSARVIEKLAEALEPFIDETNRAIVRRNAARRDDHPMVGDWYVDITFGDMRRADAALALAKGKASEDGA